MITRLVLATTIAVAAAATPAAAADGKPKTFKSVPCAPGGVCAEIFKYVPLDGPLTSLQIKAPAAGTALVTLTGTMQCVNSSSGNYDKRVVDVSGQIVKRGETASASGPNATRFAMRMPERSTFQNESVAVNLASTRLFDVTQGRTVFEYRIVYNRVDEETMCTIFDLNLTALYVP
jgi:hypothetical protein